MEWGWPTGLNEKKFVVASFTHIYGFLTGITNLLLRDGSVFITEVFDPNLIAKKHFNE